MRFLVAGAGGFSKEIADLLAILGHDIAAFYDDSPRYEKHPTTGHAVVSDLGSVDADAAVIAVGDSRLREHFDSMLRDVMPLPPLVHPSAQVSPHARVDDGVLVMNNAVVSADASLERCALVNVACYVAHDCSVGAYAQLAAGVQLGGCSSVGASCLCGTGAIVLPGISVGDGATCGAGAVIVKDVPAGATVVGVPARASAGRGDDA